MTDGLTPTPDIIFDAVATAEPEGGARPSELPPFTNMARASGDAKWAVLVAVPSILFLYILLLAILAAAIAFILSPWIPLNKAYVVLELADLNRDWSKASDKDALLAFSLLMGTFPPLMAAVWLFVRFVHKRPFLTLVTGKTAFDSDAFTKSLAVSIGVITLFQGGDFLLFADHYRWVFQPARFFMFLPLVLVMVPLQVLAEEIFFRGYLLQAVARLTRNPYIIVGAVSLLFAGAHLSNPEVGYGGNWAMAHYLVIAIYLTWLAVRGNGIEYSFGFHLGNNLFALSVVTSAASSFPSPTLLYVDYVDLALELPILMGGCALHYWLLFGRRRAHTSG